MRKCIMLLLNLALSAMVYAAPCSDPELANLPGNASNVPFLHGYPILSREALFRRIQPVASDTE